MIAARGSRAALGMTWTWLAVVVIVPLGFLVARAGAAPFPRALALVLSDRTVAALRLSVGCALAAASLDVVFGLAVAWVLERYRFPGRDTLDAIVELPLALPTSVAGITLTYLYAEHGPLGRLVAPLGLRVAFAPPGIVLALAFVGLPLVVRAVQPVVRELDASVEEAARSLGASALQTFARVQLPTLLPAAAAGFALSLARALGEYGSVVFVSGNIPFKTEIAPLLVVAKLEQYDEEGAAVLAVLLLALALGLLSVVHAVERRATARAGSA